MLERPIQQQMSVHDLNSGSPNIVRTLADFRVESVRVPAGARVRRHAHEHLHVCAVLEGGFVERRGQSRVPMLAGSVRVSPAAWHDMDFGPTGASCLVIEIDKQAEGHLDRLAPRSAEYFTIPWLRQLTEAIDRQTRRLDSLAELTLEGHLVELVAQLSRLRRPRALSAPPPWLRSVREMLHAHPGRAPTGEALAAFTGAHRVHVLRSFRDHFGVSIGQYARRIRLQRAHQLLTGTALPLADVAQEAGFADQAHLSRAVRSALGLTPAEIRRASGRT